MKDTIHPLGDRVVIKSPEEGDITSKRGKIILTETSTRGKTTWGKVLLVGPGIYTQTGDLIPTTVNVGDLVMYKKDMVGDKIIVEEQEYIMFREHDLMMVDRQSPTFDPKQLLNDSRFDRTPSQPTSIPDNDLQNDSSPMNTFKSEF